MFVFCYARIMVDMVDAVGDFKIFSEFMSHGGRFKQIFVLAVSLNACGLGPIAPLLRSPPLASRLSVVSMSFFRPFLSPSYDRPQQIASTTPQLSHANRVFKF